MKELDYLQNEMNNLVDKIAEEREKEAADNVAEKIRLLYDAMIKVGFADAQAWWLVTAYIKHALEDD